MRNRRPNQDNASKQHQQSRKPHQMKTLSFFYFSFLSLGKRKKTGVHYVLILLIQSYKYFVHLEPFTRFNRNSFSLNTKYEIEQVSLINRIVQKRTILKSLRLFYNLSPMSIDQYPLFERKGKKKGFSPRWNVWLWFGRFHRIWRSFDPAFKASSISLAIHYEIPPGLG